MRISIVIIFIISFNTLFAQTSRKTLNIKRVQKAPKIDASLNDIAWENAKIATDFVMYDPGNDKKDPNRTEVKVVYNDEAIYISAYLYDSKPEEIPMEFQTRDKFGNADYFGVTINAQNDGINQKEFLVMSTGNQNDAQITENRKNYRWNTVWKSKVKVVKDGWIVEMKIPYSALRFSNEKIQTWGINFFRSYRNTREKYSWNFVDINNGHAAQYDGTLTGIENIKPPIRLSINPYVFGAIANTEGENEFISNAGMDIKYGLSENFTLDATLIPDFGQTTFDKIKLNLTPFEQKYSEKRDFFTEGVDLFTKGDFFYSRRIGNSPIGRSFDIASNEIITDNPKAVDMLNAVKISGRTKGGLGIGVFNAVTKKTWATIKNEDTNTTRKVVTEPLTNYNVTVLDWQFNRNSSVSFVNTKVIRNGSFRDANVSGLIFNLHNKSNKYAVIGKLSESIIHESTDTNIIGYQGRLDLGKTSGKHRGGVGVSFRDDKYDQNDLGYQRRNNYIRYDANYAYRILKPTNYFNRLNMSLYGRVYYLFDLDRSTDSYQVKNNLYQDNLIRYNVWAITKKQLYASVTLETSIEKQYDYSELERYTNGRFYKSNPISSYKGFISTDYSKKFAIDVSYLREFMFNDTYQKHRVSISPRFRFNNRFNLKFNTQYSVIDNQKGLVNIYENDIIFGNRDRTIVTNSLTTEYNFNTKAALNLAFRHYWSPNTYDSQFFKLNLDGSLSTSDYDPEVAINRNHNANFNSWNVDLNFTWEFSPGSELIALYRNQIGNNNRESHLNFFENLDNLFKQEQLNSFSVKLVYFLDYNKAKSWF